jgi:G:T/U mismatch-specific DNA glycosylase
MQRTEIVHSIPPFYRPDSHILIIGSFPSVKSREQMFFYGHPQNRFWRVTAAVFGDESPASVPEKRAFLERNRIALWDSIGRCTIEGSADSSIRDVVPNDLSVILSAAPIDTIYCNGKQSFDCYNKYIRPSLCREAILLPSTSPANASWRMDRLIEAWRVIRNASADQ